MEAMVRGKGQSVKRNRSHAGSWMALLAATTLGVDAADTVSALVKVATPLSASGPYRLVVQSYDEADGELPGSDVKPVGSMQRTVTAEELKEGVRVNLLELRTQKLAVDHAQKPIVVAWVEAGPANLEFDGRRARPQRGGVYGVAIRREGSQQPVEISLRARRGAAAA